jgi:hypothetical protein
MLPHFDVEVVVGAINPEHLRVIWVDEVSEDGIGDNRLYIDLTGTDWSDIAPIIQVEEALIKVAAERAANADDFDRIIAEALAAQYPGDDIDEGPLSDFALLDAGVISAAAALSAAGCVSTTSCRGHNGTGEPHPLIRFAADDLRLGYVREAAVLAGCGLLLDGGGMLQLFATNVLAFVAFAKALLEKREYLEAITSTVACTRPGDDYLYDYDDDVRRRDLAKILERVDAERIVECDGQLSLFECGP